MKQISILSLLISIVVAVLVGFSAKSSYIAMNEKAEAQKKATLDFQEWKKEYLRLLPVEKKWEDALQPSTIAKDLYSLYTLIGDKPFTNPDAMTAYKIERVSENNKDLGASRICVSSAGSSQTLDFSEKNFSDLIAGLKKFSSRLDVHMTSIVFKEGTNAAVAEVSGYCLLVRDPSTNEGAK